LVIILFHIIIPAFSSYINVYQHDLKDAIKEDNYLEFPCFAPGVPAAIASLDSR
jgi:hypothetical protein